jgi:hypothetical protein
MSTCSENLRSGKARCALCDGKFGLVRYYSWRTPLCSRKCVDRFRSRRDSYYNWGFAPASFDERAENCARAS